MEIRRLTQEEWERVYAVIQSEADAATLTTSEELHQLAWNYNWDDGMETMRQVILNPLCDMWGLQRRFTLFEAEKPFHDRP